MAVNLLADLTEIEQDMSGDYRKLLDRLDNGGELDEVDLQVGCLSSRSFAYPLVSSS